MVNMGMRNADAGMDSLAFGQRQGVGRRVDVLGHGTGQRTDDRQRNGLGNLADGIEIARTRHGKSRLDDIHAEGFERSGHLYFFNRIELAAGNLLPVAQRRVENIQLLTHGIQSVFVSHIFRMCYKITLIVKFYIELQIYKYVV